MKLLIFSAEYPPLGGGAGVVAHQLASGMSKLGWDVTVLARYCSERRMDQAYRIIQVKDVRVIWSINYFVSVNFSEFDRIILNDPVSVYTAGLFFSKEILKRCVCLLHGSEPEYFYQDRSYLKRFSGASCVSTRAYRLSSAVFAHSKFMKSKILSVAPNVISEDHVSVLYFGYDAAIFEPSITGGFDFCYEYNLSSTAIVLLSVSRVDRGKGYEAKLKIFNELVRDGSDVYWFIIGEGPYVSELLNNIGSLGLNDRVFLLGKKGREELPGFFMGADLFWLLSEYREAFGLVYIEAQAMGTPAVGYNRYGVSEAICHNKTGFLLDSDMDFFPIVKERRYLDLNSNEIREFAKTFQSKRACETLNVHLLA